MLPFNAYVRIYICLYGHRSPQGVSLIYDVVHKSPKPPNMQTSFHCACVCVCEGGPSETANTGNSPHVCVCVRACVRSVQPSPSTCDHTCGTLWSVRKAARAEFSDGLVSVCARARLVETTNRDGFETRTVRAYVRSARDCLTII